MGVLKIADFHYGAFLSALLNYGKKKPSLFDKSESNDSRRVYRLTTDNSPNDYIIFTKAVMAQNNKTEKFEHWIFNFDKMESTFVDIKMMVTLREARSIGTPLQGIWILFLNKVPNFQTDSLILKARINKDIS